MRASVMKLKSFVTCFPDWKLVQLLMEITIMTYSCIVLRPPSEFDYVFAMSCPFTIASIFESLNVIVRNKMYSFIDANNFTRINLICSVIILNLISWGAMGRILMIFEMIASCPTMLYFMHKLYLPIVRDLNRLCTDIIQCTVAQILSILINDIYRQKFNLNIRTTRRTFLAIASHDQVFNLTKNFALANIIRWAEKHACDIPFASLCSGILRRLIRNGIVFNNKDIHVDTKNARKIFLQMANEHHWQLLQSPEILRMLLKLHDDNDPNDSLQSRLSMISSRIYIDIQNFTTIWTVGFMLLTPVSWSSLTECAWRITSALVTFCVYLRVTGRQIEWRNFKLTPLLRGASPDIILSAFWCICMLLAGRHALTISTLSLILSRRLDRNGMNMFLYFSIDKHKKISKRILSVTLAGLILMIAHRTKWYFLLLSSSFLYEGKGLLFVSLCSASHFNPGHIVFLCFIFCLCDISTCLINHSKRLNIARPVVSSWIVCNEIDISLCQIESSIERQAGDVHSKKQSKAEKTDEEWTAL